jgi:hypothetical protein
MAATRPQYSRHRYAADCAKRWFTTRREVAYAVVGGIFVFIGQAIGSGVRITVLSLIWTVLGGIVAAAIAPCAVYAVSWLMAPAPLVMRELADLRADVKALADKSAPGKPEKPEKAWLELSWLVDGDGPTFWLQATNASPLDGFLTASVLAVESTTSSFELPFVLAWEGSTSEQQFLAAGGTHSVRLADAVLEAEDSTVLFRLHGAKTRAGFPRSETIRPRDKEVVLTIAIYSSSENAIGRSVGKVRLSYSRRRGNFYAQAEKLPEEDAAP